MEMGVEMGVYMEVSKRQSSERTHQPENAKLTTLDAPFSVFQLQTFRGFPIFIWNFFSQLLLHFEPSQLLLALFEAYQKCSVVTVTDFLCLLFYAQRPENHSEKPLFSGLLEL